MSNTPCGVHFQHSVALICISLHTLILSRWWLVLHPSLTLSASKQNPPNTKHDVGNLLDVHLAAVKSGHVQPIQIRRPSCALRSYHLPRSVLLSYINPHHNISNHCHVRGVGRMKFVRRWRHPSFRSPVHATLPPLHHTTLATLSTRRTTPRHPLHQLNQPQHSPSW